MRGLPPLDVANRPLLFKVYETLPPLALPAPQPGAGLAGLAHLLLLSAGLVRHLRHGVYRAAACTGALYEIELYVVCGDLEGLPAGVYHFAPYDFALRRLREGDYRGNLEAATTRRADLYILCTGTYWRNAWKYQARTYRHFGWDNGTLLANMLAVAGSAEVLTGFVDDAVNELLGLDTVKEVTFSVVTLGSAQPSPPLPVQLLSLPTRALSAREVEYPAMRELHAASSLASADAVRDWRRTVIHPAPRPAVPVVTLPAPAPVTATLEQTIRRRGSTRRFSPDPIDADQLAAALQAARQPFACDCPGLHTEVYVVVNAVTGVGPGAYYYDGSLHTLRPGNLRAQARHTALDQALGGDAAAAIYFLADLDAILDGFGDRGYRMVHLEAGVLGGQVYLAAYGLGLGATGLTFYDDAVVELLRPHAEGLEAIFMVAVGHPFRPPETSAPTRPAAS